jgi:photosystem II stability/assembly factor-like uncharacterized protein
LNGAIIGNHRLITTSDGGINWQLRTVPTSTQTCLSVLQTDPSDISVGTDSGWVYSSSDTGKTWLSEKISAGPVRSLFVWRGTPLIGGSKYALTPFSLCIQYVIPPPSWSEYILPNFLGLGSEGFDAEFCNGGSTGFIVGVQGDLIASPAVLRKTITDTVWRLATAGISRMGTLFGVSAPSANVVFVCGSTGLIYKSSNGGDNWRDQSVPKSRDIKAIYFYNELRGFAVGDSGTILYTSNGGENPVGVKENVQGPTTCELNQNYPNPFNPTTVISFQLPARSYTTLKIYDLIGREVATIVSEELTEGNHTRQWNAERLPSGVYFYRLQTGIFTETKKLILLR